MDMIVAAVALETERDPVIARALQLAALHRARLVLVHVMEIDMEGVRSAPGADTAHGLLRAEAERRIHATVADLAPAVDPEVVPEVIIAEGRPFQVIEELTGRMDADLLLIGAGTARNIREKILGSTADRLIRSSRVPVLVARKDDPLPYRNITVAIDPSDASMAAAKAAHRLGSAAPIAYLHVVEIPLSFEEALLKAGTPLSEVERYRRARRANARKELQSALEAAGIPYQGRLRVVSGDARDVLIRRARNPRTDLIALGTNRGNAVSQMLLGSVARNVLQGARCDVLITAMAVR